MKKLIILLLSICLGNQIIAQSIKLHEIGIGLGYLTTGEGNIDSRDYPNSYFISKTQSIFLPDYYTRNQVKLKITPVLFYTFNISNRFNIRSNIQYAELNSTIPDYNSKYPEPEYLDYSYQDKTTNLAVGLAYIFRKKKAHQLYFGADFLFQNLKNSSSGSGYLANDKSLFYNQNRINVTRKYGTQILFGVKKNIYKTFTFKYETSVGLFTNLYFRPINRVSINYNF